MAESEKRKVAVIGAGVAGVAAALTLKQQGIDADIYEKEDSFGGHLKKWHTLFPGRDNASSVLNGMMTDITAGNLNILVKSDVKKLSVKTAISG